MTFCIATFSCKTNIALCCSSGEALIISATKDSNRSEIGNLLIEYIPRYLLGTSAYIPSKLYANNINIYKSR